MDFGDIIKFLVFIYIFGILPARKRKAAKEKNEKKAGRDMRPRSRKGRLDSTMNMPSGRTKPDYTRGLEAREPEKIEEPPVNQQVDWQKVYSSTLEGDDDKQQVDWQKVYSSTLEGDDGKQQVDWQQVYTGESQRSAGADKRPAAMQEREEEKVQIVAVERDMPAYDLRLGFTGRDDVLRGIIMAEIIQPPVSRRPNKRRFL